jgi:hypothetical protein
MKSKLNPKLFQDHELRPEVSVKFLEICEAFIDFAGIPIDAVDDCVLTGSNASYGWKAATSDCDIHVIYDPSKMSGFGDHLETYLITMKQLFNLQHRLKIRGIRVEVYPQAKGSPLIAQGVWSIKNDTWVKEPANLDVESHRNVELQNQTQKYAKEVADAIQTKAPDDVFARLKDKFREFRRTGLASNEGELSFNNQLFKSLRSNKVFDRMNRFLNRRENQKLSLENRQPASDEQLTTLKEELGVLALMTVENLLVEELEKHYPEKIETNFETA